MKKLLLCLLLVATSATYAHKVELVNTDGFMPLRIDSKISFYVTKEYTDSKLAPIGTQALFIVTVDCKQQLHKRSLTEIYDPSTKAIRKIFKGDEEIAASLRDQKFSTIDSELVPIASTLCKTMIK